ncbi:Ppx/GppA phosphatase family protein [Kineosporia succinea]|uniref:Exopolyphosphatase/guanosine-5'-triphosphate, 3'-diphosphate pyrophosphatase n=1 Tax=Kineosporia succinea TaxID=84632 RepID=A0ABT9NYU0_9ACTN|nr:Ppx/GppA phosphatase family protein [Kineosporia succinea]MDP9825591.1 exopolyphosphatase/guanosine-5'-triphosphate,3'-diphosphate pyrophosphatase [Kineosporia succinea]
MTRVAAIDCGTNSIRLLIADMSRSRGTLVDVERRMEIVRLGQGVDQTGEINPEAMERTLEAARRYADLCHRHEVHAIRFVATSATRDARNRKIFVAGIRDALGVEPEVIPGAEEAELSFTGATAGLPGTHPAPSLVVDLGGGSTEFVLGEKRVESAISVNVGCVRLTERHLRSDPPTPAEIAAATADIDAALAQVAEKVPLEEARTLVGVAGSITTVTAHALGLSSYDPKAIHGAELTLDQVERACTELIEMPRAQRAELPFMHPGRVDVIGAGALVWRRIVERMGATGRISTQVTSEHDILDGMAWGLA